MGDHTTEELATEVVRIYERAQNETLDEILFSNSRTGVKIDSIKTGWRNACEEAGLVNLRFHDTRHTFARRLRANGVHEWDIRDLLGHASVRMTSVYTHQTPANLCHAVNTLGQNKLGKVVRFKRRSA